MRKVTEQIVEAFYNGTSKTVGSTMTDGKTIMLHNNMIAWKVKGGGIGISSCGWKTATTRERLNGLHGVYIQQKDFQWFLNGKKWGGKPVIIN